MRKDTLEREKLELEVNRLKQPWYKNIDFWKSAIPALTVIATVILSFVFGLFDLQKRELEIDKKQLVYDIKTFKDVKDSINEVIKSLNYSADSIQNYYRGYTQKLENDKKKSKIFNDNIINALRKDTSEIKNLRNVLEQYSTNLNANINHSQTLQTIINRKNDQIYKQQLKIDSLEKRIEAGKIFWLGPGINRWRHSDKDTTGVIYYFDER
jgi:hypothetical protein